jgi:hypothetical protein
MERFCRASREGLLKAKESFYIYYGETQKNLAGAASCHCSDVVKFFARKTIEKHLFQAICTKLYLNWSDIVELEDFKSTLESVMNLGLNISYDNPDAGATINILSSQTHASVENNSAEFQKAWVVLMPKLVAEIQVGFGYTKEEVEVIIASLRQLVNDVSLTIQDIRGCGRRFTLIGSNQALYP